MEGNEGKSWTGLGMLFQRSYLQKGVRWTLGWTGKQVSSQCQSCSAGSEVLDWRAEVWRPRVYGDLQATCVIAVEQRNDATDAWVCHLRAEAKETKDVVINKT